MTSKNDSISDLGSETDLGSDNDAETAGLVAALLSAGLAPLTIAASLGIDEDTLRRWRRGVEASPLARRAMRLLLTVRHIAPSLLPGVWTGDVADLTEHLNCAQMRWMSLEEVERKRRTDRLAKEFVSAPKRPSRWASIEGVTWRDGAEGGGL